MRTKEKEISAKNKIAKKNLERSEKFLCSQLCNILFAYSSNYLIYLITEKKKILNDSKKHTVRVNYDSLSSSSLTSLADGKSKFIKISGFSSTTVDWHFG